MPRIAFLSEHASPLALLGGEDAGGQNVYVDEVSRNLGLLGYTVDVFTRRDAPSTPKIVDWARNVRVIHLPAGPARFLLKDALWPHMPAFRESLLHFAAREGCHYDLLHGNFWMSGAVAVEAAAALGIPAVQIFHATGRTKRRHQAQADTSPDERIAVEERIVRSVDALIAQCPAEESELINEYAADPEKVHVIPSAVNIRRFRPMDREEARAQIGLEWSGPLVVYVGRLLPRKDVRNVVEALSRLSVPARLLIVGGETENPDDDPTPEMGVLRALAERLGVADRVHFTGKRQPEQLRTYYSAGDVAVTTPWYEPFGLTPLEAMACGRPVVGSAVGGIAFTIRDGETGALVPPRDPHALAARLDALLGDEAARKRMGISARTRVERQFTWPLVAQRTAALYDTMMRRTYVSRQGRGTDSWRA